MNHTFARWAVAAVVALFLYSCSSGPGTGEFGDDLEALSPDSIVTGAGEPDSSGFVWQTEQFADIKMIRYQVPGWEKLSPRQQALVYCLNQAGLSGDLIGRLVFTEHVVDVGQELNVRMGTGINERGGFGQ